MKASTLISARLLFPFLGLLFTHVADAVTITNFGVDTITRHIVIDSTASTVTHNPGMVFFEFGQNASQNPSPQTYPLSGKFDAHFSRYWWDYVAQGQNGEDYGPFTLEQNWLTFDNASLVDNPELSGFNFPSYFLSVNGTGFTGDNSPCNFPSDPNTYCSGNIMFGSTASLRGNFENGTMTLDGWSPLSGGNLFEGYDYHIQGYATPIASTPSSQIPEPNGLLLFLTGMCALLLVNSKLFPLG